MLYFLLTLSCNRALGVVNSIIGVEMSALKEAKNPNNLHLIHAPFVTRRALTFPFVDPLEIFLFKASTSI